MDGFIEFLEQMPLSIWVREARTIWAFPTILFIHSLGMAIVAGGSTMISLVLLGFWPAVPIRPFARLFPVMWVAFVANAVTGTLLLLSDAGNKLRNPDFYIKMVLVFAGLALLIRVRKRVFDGADGSANVEGAKGLAMASIGCWFGAIMAGRLLAYVGQ